MTKLEAIEKEINKKPTQKAWSNLCQLFLETTDDETQEGLQAIAKLLPKWQKKLTLSLEADANKPVHPLLSFVQEATLSVEGLEAIPEDTADALAKSKIKRLHLKGCENLTSLKEVGRAKKLQELYVVWCRGLKHVEGLETLKSLRTLELSGSFYITDLSNLKTLKQLKRVDLTECKLEDLQGLRELKAVKDLILTNCNMLQSLEGVAGMESLQNIDLLWCDRLQDVSELAQLTKLKRINMTHCDYLDVPFQTNLMLKPKEISSYLEAVKQHYSA